jgi:hypothetical protein
MVYKESRSLLICLSVTMINCIMKGYIGNLREMNAEPMLSKEMMKVLEDAIRIVESSMTMKDGQYSDGAAICSL